MADAKDILGLSRTGSDIPSSEKRRNNKETQKKPDGVSREVYSLIGGLPPVMASVAVNQKKPVQEPTDPDKRLGWRFVPFTSSARNDNLQLHHWDRVMLEKAAPEESNTTEAERSSSIALADKVEGSKNFPRRPKYTIATGPPKDYAFAKFNRAADIIRYTDDEYATHLEDANWTREETDKLFDLCEQFDLRFIVIADRFPTPRSVEELKGRYYSAAKGILERRATNQEMVADHTLVKNVYDYEYEVHRKKTLEIVLSQNRRREREANKVLDEAQRIREERYKEKLARKEKILELNKRAKVLKTEEPEDADLAAVKKSTGIQELVGSSRKTSTPTRPRRPPPRSQATHTSSLQVATLLIPAKRENPEASCSSAAVEQNPVTVVSARMSAAVDVTDYFLEAKIPGVFLRSQVHAKMVQEVSTQAGARNARRINQMFQKYNCRSKLTCFTKGLCALHLELRNELHELLKLEQRLQSIEAEIKTLKAIPKAPEKTSPSTPRRLRGTGTVSVTDSHTSSGDRMSKRERRRSVRTME